MNTYRLNSLLSCACALVLALPLTGWSQSRTPEVSRSHHPGWSQGHHHPGWSRGHKKAKTIFFVRHGEDTTALRETGEGSGTLIPDCTPFLNDGESDLCCLDILNPLGEKRAELLAQWFAAHRILPRLTHVFSTYKTRTWQTVLPTAQAAGLDVNPTDIDKNPGDGVQQIPPFVEECESGFESPSSTLPLVVAEIRGVPLDSRVLVCGHSPTLYPMMEMLGIDTSNPVDFPRRSDGRVDGFNNLWIVSVDQQGVASLTQHLLLDFTLATTAP